MKRGLGKGLAALIPDAELKGGAELLSVAVSSLKPNPRQPRRVFEETALEELAASIKMQGILEPLVVRRVASGYEVIAGERRWRAAQIAGVQTVPAVVRDLPDDRLLEMALVENLQREDLNPVEEAEALAALADEHHWTQEELSGAIGKSRSAVANAIRLLELPKSVLAMVRAGRLSRGHAKVLAGVEPGERALHYAERCVEAGWSVRQLEAAIRLGGQTATVKGNRPRFGAWEERLTRSIGAPVRIEGGRRGGRITIRWRHASDLERIVGLVGGLSGDAE